MVVTIVDVYAYSYYSFIHVTIVYSYYNVGPPVMLVVKKTPLTIVISTISIHKP